MKPKKIMDLARALWEMLVVNLPGKPGYELRYAYWKKRLALLGRNVLIEPGVHMQGAVHISIDDDCWIDRGVIIMAGPDRSARQRRTVDNPDFPGPRGSVYIGKGVHVAPYVIISGIGGVHISECGVISAGSMLYSFSHHVRSDLDPSDRSVCFARHLDERHQFMIEGPIFLGRNVGIGVNCTILPGVSIGPDSNVLPGSVVKNSFAENSRIAGNPAARTSERFSDAPGS